MYREREHMRKNEDTTDGYGVTTKDVVAAMRSRADRVLLTLIVSYTGCPAWGSPVITPSAHATHANKRGPTHQCAFGLETARRRLTRIMERKVFSSHAFLLRWRALESSCREHPAGVG